MTDIIITRYADLTGRGFDRHPVDGETVDRAYWEVTRQLIDRPVPQPSEFIRNTSPHPVWTLRQVQVADTWCWVFSVQGRGDRFGVAGTCRFGFLPGHLPARDAWVRGREELTRDDGTPPAGPAEPMIAEGIEEVIVGLATDERVIRLPGTPAQAAMIIERALGVVPPDEATRRIWATCLLQDNDLRKGALTVAGGMPATFRDFDAKLYDRVEYHLPHPTMKASQLAPQFGPDFVSGVGHLVATAVTGAAYRWTGSASPTMRAFVAQISAEANVIAADTFEVALADPARRGEALRNEKMLRQWVGERPDQALDAVRRLPAEESHTILRLLIDKQRRTRANLLDLPTATSPGDDGWADELRSRCEEVLGRGSEYSRFLRDLVNHGPLHEPAGFHAARALWIDTDEKVGDARLLTATIELELQRTPQFTGAVQSAVGWLSRPAQQLADSHVPNVRLSGQVAAQLIGAAINGRGPADDVRRLTQAVAEWSMPMGSRDDAQRWCDLFRDQLNRRPSSPLVAAALQTVDAVFAVDFPLALMPDEPRQNVFTTGQRLIPAAPAEPPRLEPYKPAVSDIVQTQPPVEPFFDEPHGRMPLDLTRHKLVVLGAVALVVGIVVLVMVLVWSGEAETQQNSQAPPAGAVAAPTTEPEAQPTEETPPRNEVPPLPPGVTALIYEIKHDSVSKAAANPDDYFRQCVRDIRLMRLVEVTWRQTAENKEQIEELRTYLWHLRDDLRALGDDAMDVKFVTDSDQALADSAELRVSCHRK